MLKKSNLTGAHHQVRLSGLKGGPFQPYLSDLPDSKIHRTLNQMKAVTFQSQKDREERLRDANVGEVHGLRSVGDGKHNEESAGQKQSLKPTQANPEIPESNIPIPREQKTDIDLTKAFDSSDTTEAEPSRTKPIQKLKTGHKDLLAGSETSGLPVLDLDDLSDPLYGGSTSGFQSVTQEHICRHCPNCADWKVDNSEHRTEAVDPNNTGTIEAEKGTLPVMPEPTEAGMLNDGEVDVDIMLTSVMICNNTHIPFIVRQYDTTRESVVYSMECVYFSWFKSPSPNTSRQHWLEFNIKSADFQWSSPLALNAETKGQHPLYVRGPNGKLFPIVVEVGDCDNAKVVTIHGNLHCANLFNRDLHFLLLCHGGENQLVQVPAKTVSPSVILSPVADISKYEMKIKIQDSVWSGTIPIGKPRPLLFWKILGPYTPDETPEFYLIFWMNGIPLCPVLLSTLDVKRAHPLCISNQGSPIGLTLTTSVQNGVHQFLVWDNDLPQLVLNNRTDMSLSISPCYPDPKKVPPMAFLWKWYMNPRSVSYYSLPEAHTPDSVSSAEVELPPLMLELEDPTSGSMSSELLVLTECSGRLVHLASTDFKVNIVKEVHSRVVTIEMASSGEISAMDIRKRLALAFTSEERRPLSNNTEVKDSAPATTVTRDSANSSTAQQDFAYSLTTSRDSANSSTAHQDSAYSLIASQNAANRNTAQQDSAYSITAIRDSANSGPAQRIVSETLDVTRTPEHSQSFSPGQNPFNASRSITAQRSQGESYFLYLLHSYNFHLKMYVHNAHCRFLEDVQQAALMVVNLDKVLVAMKNGHYKRQASAGYKFTETSVVVNNIQVDNTLYKYGKYDFNVILFKNISNSNASRVNYSELFETTVAQLKRLNSVEALMNYLIQPNHCDHENFLNLQVNFHSTPRLYLLDLIRVHINTPFILRIEDVYLSRLNAYWKRLLRLKLSPPSEESGDPAHNPALPLATTAGYELAFPLRIGTISIEAFTLSLCLHTSSRFYIALDNSPLSFARFERNALVTSSYRLGQAISLHYFLNAIYATGWAIGRLEFCGTPGGLARSVGTGIRDFLTLPYQALGSGPTGFILGLYTRPRSFAKSRVLSYVQSTTSELFPTTPPSHSTNHSAEFSTNEITSSISGTVSEGHVLFLDPTLKRTVCNVLETLKMFLELRN
ncbi:uncharacterized protein LOC103515821 [Diaphorina citri]|uniref:Uncharacterized protein LOC103515821 n=1 Tax=Diaphorina citri TaxID=121845 RepID=A0A3Q0JB77_DIACI|nr:uncharacterized protein LOC103515821 [Diaphorina citri]